MSIQLLTQGLKKAAGGGYSAPTYHDSAIGSGTSDTVTIPTHNTGDIVVAFVSELGSGNPSTSVSGWTYVGQVTNGTVELLVFWQVAGGTPETSLTVTDADKVGVIIYRPSGGTPSVGATATDNGATTAGAVPALTLDVTDGSSVVVAGVAAKNDDGLTAFGTMTERQSSQVAGTRYAYIEDAGAVSSFAEQTGTLNGADSWCSYSVEIKVT